MRGYSELGNESPSREGKTLYCTRVMGSSSHRVLAVMQWWEPQEPHLPLDSKIRAGKKRDCGVCKFTGQDSGGLLGLSFCPACCAFKHIRSTVWSPCIPRTMTCAQDRCGLGESPQLGCLTCHTDVEAVGSLFALKVPQHHSVSPAV